MASRTVLPLAALSLCVALVSLSPTPATADTRVGRLGILCDVHGYRVGNYVVVPLRGIAEWLGAEVTYKNPTIELKRGKHVAKITLNKKTATVDGRQITLPTAPKVYDGITCVPLKLISAAFGATLSYRARSSDDDVYQAILQPYVEVIHNQRTARVLVHGIAPGPMAQIISEVQKKGGVAGRYEHFGTYGNDWIMEGGGLLGRGYAWSGYENKWDASAGVFDTGMGGGPVIWRKSGSGWRDVVFLRGFIDMDEREMDSMGIPKDVIANYKRSIARQ